MRKGSVFVIFLVVIGIIAIFGMVGYIFLSGKQHSTSSSTYQQSNAIPVKDYAPNIPMDQKTTILIQTSDSSDIKYIVPTGQVSTYIKSLPEGYHVVSQSP